MGYMRHDAVIMTVSSYQAGPDMDAFRESIPEKFRPLVLGPIEAPVNGYRHYVLLPDGSKEGWGDSDMGDDIRERFIGLFPERFEDGSSPCQGVHVTYGGDCAREAGVTKDASVTHPPTPAVHPAALVLADHQQLGFTRSATDPATCDCGWRGALCDHPAHLAEVLDRAGLLAPGTPANTDMDILAQVVAELQDIYRSAVTEPETGNPWRDGYVTGYVRAMRTALTIAGGTPPETPTTRVLAERVDRRTT